MKKSFISCLLIALVVCLSSCIRSSDWDYLHHLIDQDLPYNVRGEVGTSLGIPLAGDTLNVSNILDILGDEAASYIDTSDGIMTVVYHTELSESIVAGGSAFAANLPLPIPTKDDAVIYTKDTILSYDIDIDFFNNVLEDEHYTIDFSIGQMVLDLSTDISATASADVQHAFSSYLSAVIDSLVITYVDHQGTLHHYNGVHLDPVAIADIFEGTHIDLTHIDLSDIVNDMPSHITASVRLTMNVNKSILHEDSANLNFSQLLDYLHLETISYSALITMRMPLGFRIGSLAYTDTLDIDQSAIGDLMNEIDSLSRMGISPELTAATLTLIVENRFPLALDLYAELLDEHGQSLGEIIPSDSISIQHAVLSSSSVAHGYLEAYAPFVQRYLVRLNRQRIDMLYDAKKLVFYINLNTGNQQVVLRPGDYLMLKAILKTRVNASINTY